MNILKIAYFAAPLIRCPRSLCLLWNFAVKLTATSRVKGLSSSEDCMIVCLSHFDTILECDGQTERWTEPIIANTAVCIACYTDVL